MCLILLAWQVHPKFPCVLAANRDELHERPTRGAEWWTDHEEILAGRDLKEGGTWLGVTRSGSFAALTNFRDPRLQRTDVRSRGTLVTDLLDSGRSVAESLAYLRSVAHDVFPEDGHHLCSGLRVSVFLRHDGAAADLGQNDGARNERRAVGTGAAVAGSRVA